jgi:hypothetical protein
VICVVLFQDSLGFVESETGYCSETCVTCDVDGTRELSSQAEETMGIKEEIPEAIKFPPIKTEHEVRLQGVCEVVPAHSVRPFIAPQKKNWKLRLTISCFVSYCRCHILFET